VIDGRERRKTIGDWGAWSLEAARLEAHDLLRGISKGCDPLEDKRRRGAESTVGDLAIDWFEKHASGQKANV